MELETELKSINAINQCMSDLGLLKSEKQKFDVDAKLYNPNNRSSGNISITFVSNWHSGDGAFIETDDIIKSYGIFYTNFKPKWQKFNYSSDTRELIVSGEDYEFVLEFDNKN